MSSHFKSNSNGLTSIRIDVHALFSHKEHLHQDIFIANMANHIKDGRVIAMLLEFDPSKISNPSGFECPDAFGSVDESSSPAAIPNTPMLSNAPSTPTSLYEDENAGEQGNNYRHRSGSIPFMAIETLEITLSPYEHHMCHDLESLLYASVWHGLGYRWKRGICPYLSESATRKKHDILREWRVGSWSEVADRKDVFLTKPAMVLDHVKHFVLKQICWNLAFLFRRRMRAVRDRAWIRKLAAESAVLGQQGAKLRVMPVVHDWQVTFPAFADVWGFDFFACQKNCCVIKHHNVLDAKCLRLV